MQQTPPRLADVFRSGSLALRNGLELAPRLRELAIVTVATSAHSHYEIAHHRPRALAAGVLDAQLAALGDFETAPHFSDVERAVIRYPREATGGPQISGATWDALTNHVATRKQVVEVVMLVAWYVASTRITVPLGIELEDGYRTRTT